MVIHSNKSFWRNIVNMNETLKNHSFYVDGWNWKIVSLIVSFYILAIAGVFFPSWEGIALLVVLYVVTGLGVTVWFHRFFTHGSFETYSWVWRIGAMMGMFSGEGPPIFWVAWHTLHHAKSDTAQDPHSPHFGGFWYAHQLWMLAFIGQDRASKIYARYTPKWMMKSTFLRSLNRSYKYWHLGLIAVLAVTGYFYGGWYYAASFVGYGYFLRTILVVNATWSVNSLSHMYGSQPYKEQARDESRNNPFVAALTFGEGWHNNHHASPTSYRHGVEWWQIDFSAFCIEIMQMLGLAWNLKPFRPPSLRREAARKTET